MHLDNYTSEQTVGVYSYSKVVIYNSSQLLAEDLETY